MDNVYFWKIDAFEDMKMFIKGYQVICGGSKSTIGKFIIIFILAYQVQKKNRLQQKPNSWLQAAMLKFLLWLPVPTGG